MSRKKPGPARPGLIERFTANKVGMSLTPEAFAKRHGNRYKKPGGGTYSTAYVKRMYRQYQKGATDTKTARGHNAGGKLLAEVKHHHTNERRVTVPPQWTDAVMNDPGNERGNWPAPSMVQKFIDKHKGNAFQLQAMIQLTDENNEDTELFIATNARHISGNYARNWWGDLVDLLLMAGPRSGTKSIAERVLEGERFVALATFYEKADNPKPPRKKRKRTR